ncbi:hypothetical protein B566_EDAN011483 [Ephemera danica]|nr:hypothetical protein B566_EDAN011483 [Ephemera danica]
MSRIWTQDLSLDQAATAATAASSSRGSPDRETLTVQVSTSPGVHEEDACSMFPTKPAGVPTPGGLGSPGPSGANITYRGIFTTTGSASQGATSSTGSGINHWLLPSSDKGLFPSLFSVLPSQQQQQQQNSPHFSNAPSPAQQQYGDERGNNTPPQRSSFSQQQDLLGLQNIDTCNSNLTLKVPQAFTSCSEPVRVLLPVVIIISIIIVKVILQVIKVIIKVTKVTTCTCTPSNSSNSNNNNNSSNLD